MTPKLKFRGATKNKLVASVKKMPTDRPNIIYKYHKVNQHLFDLLMNGQLWFSHQNELNDPYDCKYALSDSLLVSLLKSSSDTFLKDLKERVPSDNFMSQDKFFDIIFPVLKSNELMEKFYTMLFGEMLGWNVCCFTTNPLNEIMWSHYAENNKGVCLEFDLSKTPELHEKLFPVNYTDTFPEINSIDELSDALLTKRTAWSKEVEWRILSNVKGGKVFNKDSLTAIYFGCNVSTFTIDNIRKTITSSCYNKINLKQLKFRIKGVVLKPMDNSNLKI